MQLSLTQIQCQRCSYSWVPRKAEVRVCPRCHSPYWDRKRGEVEAKIKAEVRTPVAATDSIFRKMVSRIVKLCDPEKIILFGSHATGHARPGSDVDLMVITRHGESKRQVAVDLYRALWDVGVAKDIIVVRPEEFDRYRDVIGTLIYPVAREGKVLYERAA